MTTATHTPTRVRPERVVGATAIALAASLLIQNVVLGGAGAPDYGAPIADVLAFHAKNRGTVAVSVGLEALNLPLLLGFLAGLHGLVRGRSEGGATWSRLGLAAGATLSAIWAIYAVAWIGVVLAAGQGAESTPTLQLAWHMHAAGLAMALSALGTTFFGAAMATHAALLTAPWQRLLGVVGPILLIVAGSASLAIADGSPMVFVGVGGLALWVVWLLATGIRLMRVKATTLVRP
ncbi:MAG TPA: hypothetical protein PK132_14475 [Dermatophilaceae bacterium]|nr:hypothetical protein [Dermatophilaceae bacterium]